MRKIIDEESNYTGNTETLVAVDESIEKKFGNSQRAYNEGFASASGVKAGTAETNGRVKNPEKSDNSTTEERIHSTTEDENAGLADN